MPFGQVRSSSGRQLDWTPQGWINNEGQNLNAPTGQLSQLVQPQAQPQAQPQDLSSFLEANGTSMNNLVDYNGKKAFRVADGYVWQNPDGSTGKASIFNPQQQAFNDAEQKRQMAQAQFEHLKAQTATIGTNEAKTNAAIKHLEAQTANLINPPAKKDSAAEGKAAGFGARAEESDRLLNDLEKRGEYSKIGAVMAGGSGLMNTLVNPFLSAPTQKALQAQRDFVNAVLRQESGAVINEDEFANAKRQYFPQPGEGDEVVAQKAANRQLAIQGFMNSAGHAKFHAPGAEKAPSSNSSYYQETLFNAKKAIAKNPAARAAIIEKMLAAGYDPKGL